jgi:hypothetical protein
MFLLAWAWSQAAGPGVLILLSSAAVIYFLFMAPVPCGAENRDGSLSRNNSRGGLLPGCHFQTAARSSPSSAGMSVTLSELFIGVR